jgi:hypothetical protein
MEGLWEGQADNMYGKSIHGEIYQNSFMETSAVGLRPTLWYCASWLY